MQWFGQLYSLLSQSQSIDNPLGRNFKRYESEEETRVLAESFGAVTRLDKLKIEPRHLGIYFKSVCWYVALWPQFGHSNFLPPSGKSGFAGKK
jgi:hypothetical protein